MKYYIIFGKYASSINPNYWYIRVAVAGEWSKYDKDDLYECSAVISTGACDKNRKVLYNIYSLTERELKRFIGEDCIEIKDRKQFDQLAVLFS